VAQHVRVHPRHPDPGRFGQVLQATGRRVPVHPPTEGVAQDRPSVAPADGLVKRSRHCWWQRDQNDFAPLAAHLQDAVAVFLAQIADGGAAGFEDPQPEQAQHGDQREIVRIVGQPGGGDQRLELQVPQAEGR
jgi:hypothetical protein